MRENMEKALIFGTVFPGHMADRMVTDDFGIVEEKLGIKVEKVSIDELIQRYDTISGDDLEKVSKLLEQLISGAEKVENSNRQEIEKAVKLYLAISEFTEQRGASAATIVCGQFIEGEESPVPCVALTFLQDQGISAACQGDIDALLTMMMFKRVSGKPTCMGNVYENDGLVTISHCVMSRRMFGLDKDPQPYYISDYHGRKPSPTIHTDIPRGEVVTIGRLTKNLESIIVGTGKVVESCDREGRCRNALDIEIGDLEKLMGVRVDHQYHFVVVCGDYLKELTALAKKSGIKVISV